MSTDVPEITTVTSKGQITIPSRLRKQFGLEKGTKLMVVPTDYGLVLKKLELPSVEEFQQRVEERAETVNLSMDEIENSSMRHGNLMNEDRSRHERTDLKCHRDRCPARGRCEGLQQRLSPYIRCRDNLEHSHED